MKSWKYTQVPNHNKTADLPLVQMGNNSWAQFYGPDREENAKLASTAPELLEALESIKFLSSGAPDAINMRSIRDLATKTLQSLKG